MPYDEAEAQRAYERRIMERRVETGCYTEAGLYAVIAYETGEVVLYLRFVDDSSIFVTKSGHVSIGAKVEKCGVTPLFLSRKWFNGDGEAWLSAKINALRVQEKASENAV